MPTEEERNTPAPVQPSDSRCREVAADALANLEKIKGYGLQSSPGATGPTGVMGPGMPHYGTTGPTGADSYSPSGDPMQTEINEQFKYHAPSIGQVERMNAMRETAKLLATLILEVCPHTPDRSVALRKLRECIMTANASIMIPNVRVAQSLIVRSPDFEKKTPLATLITHYGFQQYYPAATVDMFLPKGNEQK